MAHFAKVQNNLVVAVLKFDGDDQENPQVILDGLFGPVESWIKTSYNTKGGIHYDQETGQPSADQTKALRKNYAAIGYTYNEELDAFIPPCPTYSNFNNISEENWTLNTQTCLWELKVPHPEPWYMYDWDNTNKLWINKRELDHVDYSTNPPKYKII